MRHNKSLSGTFATQAAPLRKSPSTQALGITKYSIVTNSNDSVTLRLMTEHDLAMLYEWLNRSHIVEWWGGEEARPTLADVQEQYLLLFFSARVRHSIHCNAEWRADWVCPVVRCSWKRGRWWEEETDPRSTRNGIVTGECITTGQRLGNQAGSSTG